MHFDSYSLLYASMAFLLVSAVLVPLVSGRRRLAGWLNCGMVGASGALLLVSVGTTLWLNGAPGEATVNLGPIHLHLLLDPLSAFFLALVAFMSTMSAIYLVRYLDHYPDYSLAGFFAAFPIFILGMVAVLVVDDLSTGFTMAWQAMTLASYFLVRFEHRKAGIRRSANKYLLLMEVAWLAIVGSVVLIGGTSPGAALHEVVTALRHAPPALVWAAFGLLLFGFGMKAGVFPLGQLWLPDAHSVAPSPVSALLSGVMLKTGVYGILRTLFWMAPAGDTTRFNGTVWGALLVMIGLATLFIGTVQSMKQSDCKRLLAYSSIGQIGYIVFGTGTALLLLASGGATAGLLGMVALLGVLYHILNHAVFKALLFLTSGSIIYATGTQDLNRLGGLIRLMPVSAVLAGIASLAIAGAPPFSGFASKWTLVATSLMAGPGQYLLVLGGIIALFTSTITLACYVKFFGMSFTSAGTEWTVDRPVSEVPGMMLAPKILLGALCLLQGLFPGVIYSQLAGIFRHSESSTVQTAFVNFDLSRLVGPGPAGVWIPVAQSETPNSGFGTVPLLLLLILCAGLALAWIVRRSAGSVEKEVPTWLCGYQELNNNNRYLDRSLYSALKNVLRWTGGNTK